MATEYRCKDMLIDWIENCVSRFGQHETALMIQNASENGISLAVSLKPSAKQEQVTQFLSEMLNYMEEAGEFTREQMMEAMEMEETYEPI